MKTVTITVNEQTDEGVNLLAFLKSLSFVTMRETEDVAGSGENVAVDCKTVPLDTFISELHDRIDKHFADK